VAGLEPESLRLTILPNLQGKEPLIKIPGHTWAPGVKEEGKGDGGRQEDFL
jgi:hypothetical protein